MEEGHCSKQVIGSGIFHGIAERVMAVYLCYAGFKIPYISCQTFFNAWMTGLTKLGEKNVNLILHDRYA